MIVHPLKPIYNKDSKILILGSFPSIKSREENFYYAHKQNRFWQVLEQIFEQEITDKKQFLLEHNIAIWDVIKSCEITNSSDASIKNVKVNDINKILNNSKISQIFVNGKKALDLYQKYLEKSIDIEAIYLPSTSSANARYSLEKLVENYQKIRKYLTESKE